MEELTSVRYIKPDQKVLYEILYEFLYEIQRQN